MPVRDLKKRSQNVNAGATLTESERMSKPDYLDQLIERASAAAGSDYKLAQMLDTNRSAVSMWKAGKRPCPAGDVALMAEIAGLEPTEWVCRAVAAQYGDTEKGKRLRDALKKALVATGAGLASSGAMAAGVLGGLVERLDLLYTMYIM